MNTSSSPHFALCPAKGFINVAGEKAAAFLQSILTANVETLATDHCMPSALLTPQGRVLFDMMIYRPAAAAAPCFIIETEAGSRDALFTALRRYRLRRPIELTVIDDMALWLGWDGIPRLAGCYADPRDPSLGIRCLTAIEETPEFAAHGERSDISVWHGKRILSGVPEGPIDLTPERALMLEAGLDRLGAVDFSKGCYIGQEVTARTHYRGLVKRRLVPLLVDSSTPPTPGEGILRDGQAISTTKTSAPVKGGVACLALLKLSEIHQLVADPTGLSVEGAAARIILPDWMLPLPAPARTDNAPASG